MRVHRQVAVLAAFESSIKTEAAVIFGSRLEGGTWCLPTV